MWECKGGGDAYLSLLVLKHGIIQFMKAAFVSIITMIKTSMVHFVLNEPSAIEHLNNLREGTAKQLFLGVCLLSLNQSTVYIKQPTCESFS